MNRVKPSKQSRLSTTNRSPQIANTPVISVHFREDVPQEIVQQISHKYSRLITRIDDDELLVDWHSTALHTNISAIISPGIALATMRSAHGLTQAELCKIFNNEVSPKRISDWENGQRSISKEWAKKLSYIFKIPVKLFLLLFP